MSSIACCIRLTSPKCSKSSYSHYFFKFLISVSYPSVIALAPSAILMSLKMSATRWSVSDLRLPGFIRYLKCVSSLLVLSGSIFLLKHSTANSSLSWSSDMSEGICKSAIYALLLFKISICLSILCFIFVLKAFLSLSSVVYLSSIKISFYWRYSNRRCFAASMIQISRLSTSLSNLC